MIELEEEQLTKQQKFEIFRRIEAYGGSFARRLAWAWFQADDENARKIEETWPELVDKYARL